MIYFHISVSHGCESDLETTIRSDIKSLPQAMELFV